MNLPLPNTYSPKPTTYAAVYNGNLVALVNADDSRQCTGYQYDPFGQVLEADGPAAALNPFGFPTKYRDAETSFLYYGYHHYNTNTARWFSCDSIEEQDGLNLYGFIGNNLINKIDIFGLQEIDVWAAAFIKPSSITLPYTSPTRGVFPFVSWLGDNRGFNPGVNSMFL